MKAGTLICRPSRRYLRPAQITFLAWVLLTPVISWSSGVVTECTESALRAAMVGGGAVTFDCDGTITLGSTITNTQDTSIDATGHQITISGSNTVRVFYVSTNTTLSLVSATIAYGRSWWGSAVFNKGGTLHLSGVRFEANVVVFGGEDVEEILAYDSQGGALFNGSGTVSATDCTFVGNVADQPFGADPSFQAQGGAVFNKDGSMSFQNCRFDGNRAVGGPGFSWPSTAFPGASSCGGAIYNSGNLTVRGCTLVGNTARGGTGGDGWPSYSDFNPGDPGLHGGSAEGGAIYNLGILVIDSSTLMGNEAVGGAGGIGGGGAGPDWASDGGPGGLGGSGRGGALLNANDTILVNSTLAYNSGNGGEGGQGGYGGASEYSSGGDGGPGGNGGDGSGGVYSIAPVELKSCTLAFNSGFGGAGGLGGPAGTGRYGDGLPGTNGMDGSATGGIQSSAATAVNTLLSTNNPGGNCSGNLTDDGYNLSSDATCGFTHVDSMNNTDPKLGPLSNNGGPTPTIALLPGSPAIDSGAMVAGVGTDQRGFSRPFGAAADIGAYEYATCLTISRAGEGEIGLQVRDGMVGQPCRLLSSSGLLVWQCLATNEVSPDGTALFQDSAASNEPQRFYRVVSP